MGYCSSASYAGKIAPPGYPNTTSTPCRTKQSHKICAPANFAIISPSIFHLGVRTASYFRPEPALKYEESSVFRLVQKKSERMSQLLYQSNRHSFAQSSCFAPCLYMAELVRACFF